MGGGGANAPRAPPWLRALLEDNGYEKRQTSVIKITVLQFMLEAP